MSVPIVIGPGEEAQFDFCNLDAVASAWGWDRPLRRFGSILCWTRRRIWWLAASDDQNHTFEAWRGPSSVSKDARSSSAHGPDRRPQRQPGPQCSNCTPRRCTSRPTTAPRSFRVGLVTPSARARSSAASGSCARALCPRSKPLAPPQTSTSLNRRAQVWLEERVHAVASRTTGVGPAERAAVKAAFFAPSPAVRLDTDYVTTRRVHDVVPLGSVGGVRYPVPPNMLGQVVKVRRRVDSFSFEVRWAGTVVTRHRIAGGDVSEVRADDLRRGAVGYSRTPAP